MAFVPGFHAKEAAIEGVWFAVGKRGLLARQEGETWVLPRREDLLALGLGLDDPHYLGARDDEAAFAMALGDDVTLPDGYKLLGIRTLVDAFDEETFAIAGRATHVLDWATTSRFCGRCGAATERVAHERAMRCPSCTLTVYPRIAPAVIVLVRKGPLALLARNGRFPVPFFSTLAGFTEIGETLERTIEREIMEEVGVRVKNPRYFGSQPWPFPNSLMVGFTAEYESGEITVDKEEIAEAQWFAADALPIIPPRISIARALIDAWIAEVRGK